MSVQARATIMNFFYYYYLNIALPASDAWVSSRFLFFFLFSAPDSCCRFEAMFKQVFTNYRTDHWEWGGTRRRLETGHKADSPLFSGKLFYVAFVLFNHINAYDIYSINMVYFFFLRPWFFWCPTGHLVPYAVCVMCVCGATALYTAHTVLWKSFFSTALATPSKVQRKH